MNLLNQDFVDDENPTHFKSTPSFWDLPAEIWLQILRHLLIKQPEKRDGDSLVVLSSESDWTGQNPPNNLLSSQVLGTNRANYAIGVEILYGENVFEMNGDDVWAFPNFLSDIGRSNVARLRHLRLDHRNAGYEDCRSPPHYYPHSIVYVNGWCRDVWLDRLFENFSSLRNLETLSVAVDLPSWKMRDHLAFVDIGRYFRESGLVDQLLAAKQMADEEAFNYLFWQVIFYINRLGISRAATSLEDAWFPELCNHMYYGYGPDGAYGVFSTKELDSITPAEKQKTAAQLLVMGKLHFDLETQLVYNMQ